MAKHFSGIGGMVSSDEVTADYESAEVFGKFRVGKTGVFFPYDLRTKYLSYDGIDRVFVRIQEVNGKLCCGSAVFTYYRIVFVRDGREFIDYISEDEKLVDRVLEAIAAAAPGIAVGYVAGSTEGQ